MKSDERKVISEKIIPSMFSDIFDEISFFELWFCLKPKWYWTKFSNGVQNKWQKLTKGYSNNEVWNFNSWHSLEVVPRLKWLRNNHMGYSSLVASGNDEESEEYIEQQVVAWEEILDKIIWAFENFDNEPESIKPENYDPRQKRIEYDDGSVAYEALDKREWDWTPIEEHKKRVQEGLDLFAKYYYYLWD